LPMLEFQPYVPMAACFALGALAWSARRVLPLNGWVLLACIALAWWLNGRAWYTAGFVLALAYGCLWFAYAPLKLQAFNRLGDYSYGLYLWGFPLQQTAVHLWPGATPTQVSLFAWPTALACAIASWHLLEKPALTLRKRARRAPRPTLAEAVTAER